MRRDVRILLGTAMLGALAQWGHEVPDAMSRMRTFRVSEVEVRGVRYLTPDEVVAQLGVTPETSVWTSKDVWTERVLEHPLVHSVEITRRVPNGLLVLVTERRPIALAPTPVLEAVDADGRRLPLDPARHRLDLPVIATDQRPPADAQHFPEEVRVLAAELDHLMSADTAFLQMVSSVRWADDETLVARWTEPRVDFLLPRGASPARLREGLGALANAMSRTPANPPHAIDLRFADQVVVRRASSDSRVAMLPRAPREED